MAVSKYQSTRETTNIARIARIILGPCTDILRDVLMKEISPSALSHKVKTYLARLPRFKRPSINKVQENLVYSMQYSNFDIMLLYFLLRNLCSFPPHSNKWGNYPSPGDRSVSANIERIRIIRNETIHSSLLQLPNSEFEHKWRVIFKIVQELEEYLGSSKKYQESLMALKTCAMDPDVVPSYLKEFQYITTLENEVREGKEKLEKNEISISSLNIKDDRDICSKTEPNTDKKKDMENFEAKVQELEGCLGPSNEYQEFLMALNTRSMDPNEKTSELMKYQSFNKLQKEIEELEEQLEKTKKSISSVNVKADKGEPEMQASMERLDIEEPYQVFSYGPFTGPDKDPSISMRGLTAFDQELMNETYMGMPGSFRVQKAPSRKRDRKPFGSMGEETEFSLGSIKKRYKDPYLSMREQKDVPPEKYEQITSETLKELFNSFKLDFPTDDPGCESFARKILEDDIERFVTAIQSLSNRIVLSSQKTVIKPDTPQIEACVFEVDVVYDDGGDGEEKNNFCVFRRKDTSSSMLFDMEEDTRVRVILIRSQSLPVVSSKLYAYKNFKHVIHEKGIFLQHEYEDFDDLAKLIAYRLFSLFCSSIESIVNAFKMDLQKIMTDNFDRLMTAKEIKQTCLTVFNETAYKPFGSTGMPRCWPYEVARLIKSKLSKEELLGIEAWLEIEKTCRQTVKDLKEILSGLEKFQTNELQVDQKKQIEEWHRIEVIPDRSKLQNYPFIIKHIAGRRNGKGVVKVFVSQDIGIKTQQGFDDCFKVWEDTVVEFVNVKEMKDSNKDDAMKSVAEKNSADYQSTSGELFKTIRENRKKIFSRYSNVIAIREGGSKQGKPCIILHCLDKDIVPFGENPLPDLIGGWPCVVREDFITFGTCPQTCQSTNQKFLEPGCSIGLSGHTHSGSVGFLYESENYGSGFLTASHVAVKDCHRYYMKNKFLSGHIFKNEIVHPPWPDNNETENKVGEVVKAFFGEHRSSTGVTEGLDLAAVRTSFIPRPGGNPLQVISYTKHELDKLEKSDTVKVKKTGQVTGTTYGNLKTIVFLDMEFPLGSGVRHDLPEVYVVENKTTASKFFDNGDSGSGVLVEGDPDKPLGIGIAISEKFPETYVCKIEDFINKFDLKLVGYCEVKQKTTSPNTEKG